MLPEVSVSLAPTGIVYEHAGERRRDHAADTAVHPLEAVVGTLVAHDGNHRALEHRERSAADDADEHTHLQVCSDQFTVKVIIEGIEIKRIVAITVRIISENENSATLT